MTRRFRDKRVVDVLLDKLSFENKTIKEVAFELGVTVATCKTYLWQERQRTGTKMLYNLIAHHVLNQKCQGPHDTFRSMSP